MAGDAIAVIHHICARRRSAYGFEQTESASARAPRVCPTPRARVPLDTRVIR
jgi:hypothetical protein